MDSWLYRPSTTNYEYRGRFLFNDAGDVPNTQIICYDYPEAPILYVVYNLPKSKEYLTPEKWNTQTRFQRC